MDYFVRRKLVKVLNVASFILAAFSLYFIAKPAIPFLRFHVFGSSSVLQIENKRHIDNGIHLRGKIASATDVAAETKIVPKEGLRVNEEKSVRIRKIDVDAKINEGATESTLNKGIWRLPYTSTPDKGGNTVLTAHRYMETSGPKTFYHLDKIEMGDIVEVVWYGVKYEYEVISNKVVASTAVEVEEETVDPILTLYTCTPLWTSKDRIVVRARLKSWNY